MDYSNINYSNEFYKRSVDVRSQIRSNPNITRAYWGSSSNNHISPIVAMLSYFTGTHLHIRTTSVSRNDSLRITFNHLNNVLTNRRNDYEYNVKYDDEHDVPYTNIHLDMVFTRYQITECFENVLPTIYNADNGYSELTGCSLALKMTPRHRVRVYAKTHTSDEGYKQRHIIVVSASNFFNYEDDFLLYRKVIALIPLFDERAEAHTLPIHAERVQYYRNFVDKSDAEECLQELFDFVNTIPAFKDLEILGTISVLKNLNEMHSQNIEIRIAEHDTRIRSILEQYTEALREQRQLMYERAGLCDEALSDDDLKMLIDKKVIQFPQLSGSSLTYRCKAPCLSFDKDAARTYYRRLDSDTDYAKLFKLAFIDEQIIIMFEDVITINFSNLSFTGQNIPSYYNRPQSLMRNPHHEYFNCWGNYSTIIRQLIQKYSFMQMFMQIKAAVGSLNLTDYTVLNYFKDRMIREAYYPPTDGRATQFIIWKSEKDTSKLHTLTETIKHFEEGESENETN